MEEPKSGKVENLLGELGKKIDQLVEKTRLSGDDFKREMKDFTDEMKDSKDRLEHEFQNFKQRVDDERRSDKWKEVEIRLENAANELKKALDAVVNRQKSTP